MIDDICPGAFAEPPTVSVWMRTGVEQIDWRAKERDAWEAMGLLPAYENAQRARRESIRAFLQGIGEHQPARWMIDTFDAALSRRAVPNSVEYSFRQAQPDPACGACKGTGEIVEFPADEDERLVACTRCGGTGEGLRT